MASPAENAATVREALAKLRYSNAQPNLGLAWETKPAFAALAALLAQAEAAARVREERADWMMRAQDAEADRDAAVRAAEQAQEALRAIASLHIPNDRRPPAWADIARAALTGEGTE